MSYFDKISPAPAQRILVDLTEFSQEWQAWEAGRRERLLEVEKRLDAALEPVHTALGSEGFDAVMVAAGRSALSAGDDPQIGFALHLPEEDLFSGLRALGAELAGIQAESYSGPAWTLQWASIDTAAGARALKNVEHIQRAHPDWQMDRVAAVAFMAAHHQAQAGEPLAGEIYDTLASRSEFAHVWSYLVARFREEFPELYASDAATLKNVFCGRALALAVAGTPQK
jgi:hypothetical protein